MQTYKQFLIYPESLICYLDHNGSLLPMFPKTNFTSLDQLKARIDQYWNEFKQYEANRSQVNYARSLEVLQEDLHDEQQQLDSEKWSERIEQYYDQQLNEDI